MSHRNTAVILALLMLIQSTILLTTNASADTDSDGDGYPDSSDDCYNVAGNSTRDLIGCPDADGDGWSDYNDDFPNEKSQWYDFDGDGYGDNPTGTQPDACTGYSGYSYRDRYGCYDADNDGYSNPEENWTVEDGADAFPWDRYEWADVDYDGKGDNGDYCRTTGTNESIDYYGCSAEDKSSSETQYTSIHESRFFAQETQGNILLSYGNYSSLHKWLRAPIPIAESDQFQVEINATTVGASATGFYLGYRVHTNAGTCQGTSSSYQSFSLYSYTTTSMTLCKIPYTRGDAFIHIFGGVGSYPNPAATIEYSVRVTPYVAEEIVETSNVDPLGDGDLGADSHYNNQATSDGEINGFFNFSANDHDEKVIVEVERTRIDRIAFTSDGPQISAYSGLDNCDYDILNSGNPILDCLIVGNPIVSLEDRIMKSRMRFGINFEGEVCQPYNTDEFANQSTILDFDITDIYQDNWDYTRVSYSSNYSGLLDYSSEPDYRNRYYRVEVFLMDNRIISTDFLSNDGNQSLSNNNLFLDEQLAEEMLANECSEVEVQLSQTMRNRYSGNLSWSMSHEIRNVYPIESIEGDQETSTVFIPVGEVFNGALGYSIDSTDEYRLEIPHGNEMKIAINSNTPYKFSYPDSESCESNEGTGANGYLEMQSGDNVITCDITNNADDIEVRLQHVDTSNSDLWRLRTDYSIEIVKGNPLQDDCCVNNDSDSHKDASYGSQIIIEDAGEYSGSFEYFTDHTDPYLVRVPAGKAALVFINGMDLEQTLGIEEGDIQYSMFNNPSDSTSEYHFSVQSDIEIWSVSSNCMYYRWFIGEFDSDGDGLSDELEYFIGTNPYLTDSDGGGENDCSEFENGRDPEQAGDDVSNEVHIANFHRVSYLVTVEYIDAIPSDVVESAPEYVDSMATEQISFTEVDYDTRLEELRLDISSLISSSQQSLIIPLEFSPLEAISLSITQSSGEPIGVMIRQASYPSSGDLILNGDLILAKTLTEGVTAYNNREYTFIDITGADGSYISIKSSTKVLSSTDEDNRNLTPSELHSGKLGFGITGLDQSDDWNFSLTGNEYAVLELAEANGLEAFLSVIDDSVEMLSISNEVIVCPPEQYQGTPDLYEGYIRVNRQTGTDSYSLKLQTQYGVCPLKYNTEMGIVNSWGNQQSASINPGDPILLEVTHSIQPQGDLTIGIQDESKRFIESTFQSENGEISHGREHLLNDELSKLAILKLPESTSLGQYKIVLSLSDVAIAENTITISEDVILGMIPSLYTNSAGIMPITPFEDAKWHVRGHEQWTGKPLDWEVVFNENWIRARNGSVIILGEGTPEIIEGRGNGMVSTSDVKEARIGSLIHHQVVLNQGNESVNAEMLSLKSRIEIGIDTDEVAYSDSSKSVNEIRFKLSATLEMVDRPIKGVSGMLQLKNEFGDVVGSKRFDTDGKGEDLVILLFESLSKGVYTTEVIPDEKWNASIMPINDREITIETTSGQTATDISLDEFQISYDLRRSVLIGTETVQIDWESHGQLPINMQWSIIEIDYGGNPVTVAVGDEDLAINQTSGLLEILLPESLHPSNNHYVRISAISEFGMIWNSGNIGVTGIEKVITPTISYSPLPPAPGDQLKIKFSCDCEGNYLSWNWRIIEPGQVIGTGEGWSTSNSGEFTFDIPYSSVDDIRVFIYASDGDGNMVNGSIVIPMQKLVNLAIEAPLYGALDAKADLSWEITSRSLTEIDKATEVEVVLQSLHSTEPLARKSSPEDGYSGDVSMHIPSGLKPGIYKLVVTAKLASGETLTQESFIEITDPVLGIEALAVTPENNRYMLLFVLVNVVAIWVLMIRSRKKKGDGIELTEELETEKELVDVVDSYDQFVEEMYTEQEQVDSGIPNKMMNGVFDPASNCEWLEFPENSGENWYRYSQDQEWSLYQG